MKNLYLILSATILVMASASAQRILKPFVLTYSDGSVVEGQMQSPDFVNIATDIQIILDGANMEVETNRLSSLVIDGKEKYITIDGKLMQVVVEGDVNLYLSQSGWMYVKKGSGEMIRLESHYERFEDGYLVSVDTMSTAKHRGAGTFRHKKDYYYRLAELFADKKYAIPSDMTLNEGSVKAQVILYDKIDAGLEYKSYFNATTHMYLYGGYRHFIASTKRRVSAADYYLEIARPRSSRRLSVFVSYRPDALRPSFDDKIGEAGVRVKLITENRLEPFISLGFLWSIGRSIGQESPSLIQYGGGLRYHISKYFSIEAATVNSNFPNFRIGIVGKVF